MGGKALIQMVRLNVRRIIDISGRNAIFLYISLYIFFQLIGFNRGVHGEEFRDYIVYVSILNGKLPYVDYRWVYGPLGAFINAFIFKLFGSELMVLRLVSIALGCVAIVLAYRISKFIMPKKIAKLSGFLAIFCFDIHIPHTYGHFYGMLANLAAAVMIFRFINSSRLYNLFLVGLLLNISFLIHPLSFGAEMFLSILVWLVLFAFVMRLSIMRFLKLASVFLMGASLFTIPIYLLILTRAPFTRVVEILWSHPYCPLVFPSFRIDFSQIPSTIDLIDKLRRIRDIVLQGLIDPLMLYLLLFIIPTIAFGMAIYWIKNKKNCNISMGILFLAVLTYSNIGYFVYSLSTLPIISGISRFFLHYPAILLVFLIYHLFGYLASKNLKFLKRLAGLSCLFFFIIFLSFYHGYKLTNLFLKKWTIFNIPSIRGIYFPEDAIEMFILPSEYIRNNSVKGDKLYVAFYGPVYYVLSGLPSIFPENIYDAAPYSMIMDSSKLPRYDWKPMTMEDVVIKKIEEGRPKFIVKRDNYRLSPGELSVFNIGPKAEKYILNNYSLVKMFLYSKDGANLGIYQRKESL